MLASRGYAVLALPYFAYEDLPAVPETLELEYFEEAVQYVLAQPNVIPDRCGMISVSKSTDIALLLSTKMPELTAVVCIGVVNVSYETDIMYRGKLLAKAHKISSDRMKIDDLGRIEPNPEFSHHYSFENMGTNPLHLEEASPDCRYLVVSGSEDTWLCHICVEEIVKYMKNHNKSDKVTGVIYDGAGHIIEPPYGPLIEHSYQRISAVQKKNVPEALIPKSGIVGNVNDMNDDDAYVTGIPIKFGGKAQNTCDAQVDLWKKTQAFLNIHVRDNSSWYQNYLSQSERDK